MFCFIGTRQISSMVKNKKTSKDLKNAQWCVTYNAFRSFRGVILNSAFIKAVNRH